MSDFETSVKQARELGYEGDELREYAVTEQAIQRAQRKVKRDKELREADLVAQKDAREAELLAQKDAREAELLAQKDAREADLRAQREQHEFEQARKDADISAQKEQREHELLLL